MANRKDKDKNPHLPSCPGSCSLTYERRNHATNKCLSCSIRRATLQVTQQPWSGGWSALPLLQQDAAIHALVIMPRISSSNNRWQMTMNMTSEPPPMAAIKCWCRPFNANPICCCLSSGSFRRAWYSLSWRQQVEKVGMQT